jgi:HSP20 family molecular chaperone IbpA
MSVLLPELASVRLHETSNELVLEVEVPAEIDLASMSAQLAAGRLEIRLPRVTHPHWSIEGFHPEASGV